MVNQNFIVMKSFLKSLFFIVLALLFTGVAISGMETVSQKDHVPVMLPADEFGGAYATFAGKYGGDITVEEIKKFKTLEVSGCAAGSRVFVFSLKVTKDGRHSSYSNESSELTEEMLNKLTSLTKGDVFKFHRIKAHLPNGKDVVDVHGKEFVIR